MYKQIYVNKRAVIISVKGYVSGMFFLQVLQGIKKMSHEKIGILKNQNHDEA